MGRGGRGERGERREGGREEGERKLVGRRRKGDLEEGKRKDKGVELVSAIPHIVVVATSWLTICEPQGSNLLIDKL